jgi:hypothetical protein
MYIRAYFIFCTQRAYAYSLYADSDPDLDPDTDPDTDPEVQNATFSKKYIKSSLILYQIELISIADKEVFSSREKKS